RFQRAGTAPRSVLIVTIDRVFFQCACAILRAKVWEPDARPDLSAIPSPGDMLAEASQGAIDGDAYDTDWPNRARRSMW
ncbi:MAG: pyridoxamine 5'-phosphate oxidase family protein, partial [Pseudomonadota bacterium]